MPTPGPEKSEGQAKAAEGAAQEQTSAFLKPLQPSQELAAIVGAAALPRPEVVSRVWEHIKKCKLQSPQNVSPRPAWVPSYSAPSVVPQPSSHPTVHRR
jgi:upstream activation factor subunit UAF30